MPAFRTLRCANAHLYTAATLIVLAAAIYVLCSKDTLWQQATAAAAIAPVGIRVNAIAPATAAAAIIITPAWAAYYAVLRITIDATGVTRRSLTGSTSLIWSELSSATLQETSTPGTESCTINLCSGATRISISSDLFPLEEVQELARELTECKLLH